MKQVRTAVLCLLAILVLALGATARCELSIVIWGFGLGMDLDELSNAHSRVWISANCEDFVLQEVRISNTRGELIDVVAVSTVLKGIFYEFDRPGEYSIQGRGRDLSIGAPARTASTSYTVRSVRPSTSSPSSEPSASSSDSQGTTPFLLPPLIPTSPQKEAEPEPPGRSVVSLGGYSVELTDLIKCASVQARPYTSMIVGRRDDQDWMHLPAVLLDSGADISILPIWVADSLGIDLSCCERREYRGVGGGLVTGYLSEVRIGITHLGGIDPEIDGYILAEDGEPFLPAIAVAFIEGDEEPILGREDVFDLLDLDFTSATVTIQVAD